MAAVLTMVADVLAPVAVTASHQFTDVATSNILHSDIGWPSDNGITPAMQEDQILHAFGAHTKDRSIRRRLYRVLALSEDPSPIRRFRTDVLHPYGGHGKRWTLPVMCLSAPDLVISARSIRSDRWSAYYPIGPSRIGLVAGRLGPVSRAPVETFLS